LLDGLLDCLHGQCYLGQYGLQFRAEFGFLPIKQLGFSGRFFKNIPRQAEHVKIYVPPQRRTKRVLTILSSRHRDA